MYISQKTIDFIYNKINIWIMHNINYMLCNPTFIHLIAFVVCIMISVHALLSATDRWFDSRPCQTKEYKIGIYWYIYIYICCFSARHLTRVRTEIV